MTENTETSVFDFRNWKPLTPEKYAEAVGEAAVAVDGLTELTSTIEYFDDGRLRVTTNAAIKLYNDPSTSHEGPYLSILFDPETGKTLTFIRSDVTLASY